MSVNLTLVIGAKGSRQAWEKCFQPKLTHSPRSVWRNERPGKEKKFVLPPTRCWWEQREVHALCLFVVLEKAELTSHIKTVSYTSQEYFSHQSMGHMLFTSSHVQLSVSSDLPDILCFPIFITAATFHSANEKIDVPSISAAKAPVQGSDSWSQSYSGTPNKR